MNIYHLKASKSAVHHCSSESFRLSLVRWVNITLLQDFTGNYADTENTHCTYHHKKTRTRDITTGLDQQFIGESSSSACKRRSLLVFENDASTAPDSEETVGTLKYPNQGQDGKRKSGPMDKRRLLMFENREERPRDRDGGREITFWCRECVCSCSGLEEEPSDEKKNQ